MIKPMGGIYFFCPSISFFSFFDSSDHEASNRPHAEWQDKTCKYKTLKKMSKMDELKGENKYVEGSAYEFTKDWKF